MQRQVQNELTEGNDNEKQSVRDEAAHQMFQSGSQSLQGLAMIASKHEAGVKQHLKEEQEHRALKQARLEAQRESNRCSATTHISNL